MRGAVRCECVRVVWLQQASPSPSVMLIIINNEGASKKHLRPRACVHDAGGSESLVRPVISRGRDSKQPNGGVPTTHTLADRFAISVAYAPSCATSPVIVAPSAALAVATQQLNPTRHFSRVPAAAQRESVPSFCANRRAWKSVVWAAVGRVAGLQLRKDTGAASDPSPLCLRRQILRENMHGSQRTRNGHSARAAS